MDPVIGSAMIGAGSNLGNMFNSWMAGERQFRRQRDLMNMQNRNQMMLNRQGHNLSYDMWKKTNFPAQMNMLKKAGLNPALMYKQGGAGGTTQQSGGGSASGGQASIEKMHPMDIAQMSLLNAQRENIKADTKDKLANLPVKESQETLNKSKEALNNAEQNLVKSKSWNLLKGIQKMDKEIEKINSDMNLNVSKINLNKAQIKLANSNVNLNDLNAKIRELDKKRAEKGIRNQLVGDMLNMMGLDPDNNADRIIFQSFIYANYGSQILENIGSVVPWAKIIKRGTKAIKDIK